jgi:hypothetical protein
MRCALVTAVLVSSSLALAERSEAPNAKARRALVAAVNARDVAAFTALVRKLPLEVFEIAWSEPACAKQFPNGRMVDAAKMDAFVTCLAGEGLAVSKEDPTDLVYGIGYRLGATFTDGTFQAMLGLRGATAPLIGQKQFLSHVKKVAIPAPKSLVKGRVGASAKVCVSADGAITSSAVAPAKRGDEAYAKSVAAAVKTWKVKPFLRNGEGQAVCVDAVFAVPASALNDVRYDIVDGSAEGDDEGVAGGVTGGSRISP